MTIGLVGGREGLRNSEGRGVDKDAYIDECIGGGVATNPVIEVEEIAERRDELEEEEEVGRAFE